MRACWHGEIGFLFWFYLCVFFFEAFFIYLMNCFPSVCFFVLVASLSILFITNI